jgi:hypothetical protein
VSEGAAFRVFSQRPGTSPDAAEWIRHAERFFETRLVLESEPEGGVRMTLTLVGPREPKPLGSRACRCRPRSEEDLAFARAASGGAGLAELAARCPTVWRVDAESAADVIALRAAAIVAGVCLGPVLSPDGRIFGPKTAREILATST